MVGPMKKGYGVPVVRIFNVFGDLIKDRKGKQIGYAVNSFEYEYDEEDPDTCIIEFKVNDPYFMDNPQFRLGVKLYVEWGYIKSSIYKADRGDTGVSTIEGVKRLVIIKDYRADYNNSDITFVLKCRDWASEYRKIALGGGSIENKKGNPLTSKDFIESLAEITGFTWSWERDGTPYYDSGKREYTQVDYNSQIETPDFNSETLELTYSDPDNPDFKKNAPVHYSEIDNTAVAKWLDKEIGYWDASRFLGDTLEEVIRDAPGGPYIVDSRDDEVKVRTRNFNQTEFRTYNYKNESGELIRFSSRSESEDKDFSNVQLGSFDPLNKGVYQGMATIFVQDPELDRARNSGSAGFVYKSVDDYFGYLIDPTHEVNKQTLEDLARTVGTDGGADYTTQKRWYHQRLLQYTRDWLLAVTAKGELIWKEQRPQPPEFIYTFDGGDSWDGEDKYGNDALQFGANRAKVEINTKQAPTSILPMPNWLDEKDENYQSPEEIVNNIARQIAERKYQGDATIVGDPYITVDRVIGIYGVSNISSGRYYIANCSHRIDDRGYRTSMELLLDPKKSEVNHTKVVTHINIQGETIPEETKGSTAVTSRLSLYLDLQSQLSAAQFEGNVEEERRLLDKIAGMGLTDLEKLDAKSLSNKLGRDKRETPGVTSKEYLAGEDFEASREFKDFTKEVTNGGGIDNSTDSEFDVSRSFKESMENITNNE